MYLLVRSRYSNEASGKTVVTLPTYDCPLESGTLGSAIGASTPQRQSGNGNEKATWSDTTHYSMGRDLQIDRLSVGPTTRERSEGG